MSRRIFRRTRQRGDVSLLRQPVRSLEEIAEEFVRRGEPITYQGVAAALKKAEAKIRRALMRDTDVMEVVQGLGEEAQKRNYVRRMDVAGANG